jgi:hypothetical protein
MSILDWIAIGMVISWFLCTPGPGANEEASDNEAGNDKGSITTQADEGKSDIEESEAVEKPATTWRQKQIKWGLIGALGIFILAFR